ncbi:MAG: alpha/beta hydrolase family protein [Acidimicrobiia bacterium]|nr:alpha/beta hydrolase family protein [Acidimicrobiia bacterium]
MTLRLDPEHLSRHCAWLTAMSSDLRMVRQEATRLLATVGRSSGAVQNLAFAIGGMTMRSDDLWCRLRFVGDLDSEWESTVVPALLGVWSRIESFDGSDNDPRLDGWLSESRGLEAELAAWLDGRSPTAVSRAVSELSPEVGRRMALRYPGLIATADGVPTAWRATATRRLMALEIDRLREERSGFGLWLDDIMSWPHPSERDRIDGRIDTLERWLASDRTFVMFDGRNDGMLVEVIGELDSADHIAVVVPGIGTTVDNFDAWVAAPAGRLSAAVPDGANGVAVVGWLGYDAPLGPGLNIDPLTRDNARAGSASLRAFVDGVRVVNPDASLTVVAHSYGSVVSGWAARAEILDVDRLVLVGSPNIPVESVADLHLADGGRVFVGEAPGDPVVWLGDVSDGWFPVLGHGWDPGDCAEFGAPVFTTDATSWQKAHSSYLTGGSAATIGQIVVGDIEGTDFVCEP